MSKIEPLAPHVDWSAEAAAADALARVKPSDRFIALWIAENGEISWSKNQLSLGDYGKMVLVLQEMGTKLVRHIV